MQKILVIGGPTAVGKSDFALVLSELINMEIISADSVQVYRGIEIATSKPTTQEQLKCKHHLVNIISPFDTFNAYDFVTAAKNAIADISAQGKLPVIVGGTGLYIDSLLYGFDFESTKKEPQFDYKFILLNDVRDNLYRKINIRVDKMLNNGLINEVKALRKMGVNLNNQCMQAIGYKEVYAYLDGELEYDEMVSLIKKNTRNYAKRQLTWFRHEKNLEEWLIQDREKLLEHLCQFYIEYKK